MKKLCMALSLLLTALLLSGCGGVDANPGRPAANTTDKVPEVLNQAEYLLYQNIFYNDYGPQYEGKEVTKRGVLAKIRDAFNDRVRYYVWGYLDNTKCCDWQWEIVPTDENSLPPMGSLVTAKGIFRGDQAALDGYWITDVTVETETGYAGPQEEINMLVMSCTLERVQMFNILYRPQAFEGKAFIVYGRIAGTNRLEDPYYNGSWQIPFSSGSACPAIGTMVELHGRVEDAALSECTLTVLP